MKSRATILVLAIAVLLLLLTAGVLSIFLLDFGIRGEGGKLPANLARGAKGRGDDAPALHETIEVGGEKPPAAPGDGTLRDNAPKVVDRTEIEQGSRFGGPFLSVGCPHCVTYGNEVTERDRFPAPAIHDIALVADGAIFTLFPGRLTEEGMRAAAAQRAADETDSGEAATTEEGTTPEEESVTEIATGQEGRTE